MSDADFPDRHVATRVAIVGAGQAGLAVAYFLRRAGLLPGQDFLVLDAGPRSGGAWQHRWESLRLGDTHKVHDLPGMHEMGLTFDDAPRDRPARDVVAAYYSMYEKHFDLRVARPAAVTWVDRTDDGYRLTLEPGGPFDTLDAQVLVNATGTWTNPRVPAIAAAPGRTSAPSWRRRRIPTIAARGIPTSSAASATSA